MSAARVAGGCQCGAVRFVVDDALGRASICHCRMCQKAFGSFFGPYVSAPAAALRWTRGAPKHFQSSNVAQRGFCGECGTPLTFEPGGHWIELAIGALDDPAAVPPAIQVCIPSRMPWFDRMSVLPGRTPEEEAAAAPHYDSIRSFQHPDRDTDRWPEN